MRTNDRADLAVPTDNYPRPDSKILIRNSMCCSEDFKCVQYPFHDKTFPNVVVISFGCRATATLLNDTNALYWKVFCSWILPDIMQARRFSFFV